MNRNRRLALERLEDRLALAASPLAMFAAAAMPHNAAAVVAPATIFDPPDPPGGNTTPVVVDPIAPGLSPIALPPFVTPPSGTTPVTLPPGGELPSDIPSLAGSAQTLAVNAMAAFLAAHPNSQTTVTPVSVRNSFAVTVTLRDGEDFAVYHVSETRNVVNVASLIHDGTHNEVILASQATSGVAGSLFQVKFADGALSSALSVREFNGQTTVRQFPEATPASIALSTKAAAKSPVAVAKQTASVNGEPVVKPFTARQLQFIERVWEPLIDHFVTWFNRPRTNVSSVLSGLQLYSSINSTGLR